MLTKTFTDQIVRLKIKFGDKAFDQESVGLIYREVNSLSDEAFKRVVDVMISSRPHTRPPLVNDFRSSRVREEKNKFTQMSHSLEVFTESQVNRDSLKNYLENNFKGCGTLHEAVEVRRHQIMMRRADDPSYDPMKDNEWT